MTKQPATIPVTLPPPNIETYLATLTPWVGGALAVLVLSLAATNLTALLWGLAPAPRFIPPQHRGSAKRSTAILGAVLLAVSVSPLLPGVGVELRALVGLVSGALSGALYQVVKPLIEAKTGLKLPESLTTKGE